MQSSFAAMLLSMLALFSSDGLAHVVRRESSNAVSTPNNTPLLHPRDSVNCYNSGYGMDRGALTTAIDDFCDQVWRAGGLTRNDAVEKSMDTNGGHHIIVSATPKGCSAIDEELLCKIVLRRPVDECNKGGTGDKQGGTTETACATWRVDPEWA